MMVQPDRREQIGLEIRTLFQSCSEHSGGYRRNPGTHYRGKVGRYRLLNSRIQIFVIPKDHLHVETIRIKASQEPPLRFFTDQPASFLDCSHAIAQHLSHFNAVPDIRPDHNDVRFLTCRIDGSMRPTSQQSLRTLEVKRLSMLSALRLSDVHGQT